MKLVTCIQMRKKNENSELSQNTFAKILKNV